MLQPILASYTAASLASPASIPISIPLRDGTLDSIAIYIGSPMSGGDATFNFWLTGTPLATGASRWIITGGGSPFFVKTGMSNPTVDGDYLSLILEEITGGSVAAPILILVLYEDGVDLIDDTAYNATTWNGVTDVAPSKNAVRDKIEAMLTQTAADIAAAVAGLSWKQAVRVATTANGTLSTAFANGQTVDGVTLATGNRILLKDQSTGAENGIYTVNASGAPTRETDADSGAELVNASVYVSEGTTNADTQWTCTTNATITVGSTSLVFAQFNASSLVSDTAYNATSWDGVTTIAPSKNAVRDKIEALPSDTQTLTNKRITARVGTTPSSATPTPDADANDEYTVTALAADATFGAPSGTPTNGQPLIIRIKDNGTSRALAWNAVYRAVGVTLPTATVISKTLYLGMIYNSADSKWDVLGVAQEA